MLIKKIQEQVAKAPNNIAVKVMNEEYTYLWLDNKSSKISNQITSTLKNSESSVIIGLLFEHGVDMISSILGALKSGSIYVPLSPKYPQQRLQYILQNSGASYVLTNNANIHLAKSLFSDIEQIINIDDDFTSLVEVDNRICSQAYILYTSGSTGQPKGVLQTQENIYHFCKNWASLFQITSADRLTLFSSFCHDGSAQDVFTALLYGATLYPYDVMERDESLNLKEFILKEKITIWHSVPSLFNFFLNTLKEPVIGSSLKYILLGGEAIRNHEVILSSKLLNGIPLVSIYGQTESSVNSVSFLNGRDKVTLGKVLDNTKIFLINENNEFVDPLSVGEIIIASDYISPGYWNVNEETNSPFINSPIIGRAYKTGDIGRLLINGEIEFLGRKDNQVKIRGFRIELGEIESNLLKHPLVKECVVLLREDKAGEKYLCAFVVLTINEKDFVKSLRVHLSGLLPDYMVPSYFIELDSFPLTGSGKIDRKALPDIEVRACVDYIGPSNDTEKRLVELWAEVLNVAFKEISVTANFFELGGHSLKASMLALRIHREFGVLLALREVLKHPTVQGQAELIRSSEKAVYTPIPLADPKEYYRLSSAQKRLYLLQQFDLESTVYNMPYTIPLGTEVDRDRVEYVLQQIVNRHESFRTSFGVKGDGLAQLVHAVVDLKIEKKTVTVSDVQAAQKDFTRAFDLSQAPLLRVAMVEVIGEGCMLMLDMHHIICDGVSHVILEKEFQQLYSGEVLPPLKLQYKDYSEWQNSLEQQEKKKKQEAYWLKQFEGDIPILNLPLDYSRPLVQSHEGASVYFTLSKEETKNIKSLAEAQGFTLYMTILSAFTILLSRLSGQEDLCIGTPIAGRNHTDLEGLVGLFVNTLVIRSRANESDTLKGFTERLREFTLEAFDHQDYQFEDLVERVSVSRDLSRNPLFDVMFNMLNQQESVGDLIGFKEGELIHTVGVSKFDLTLTAVDYGEQQLLRFEYCTKLFKAETIERYIGYFKRVVNRLAAEPDTQLSEIELLDSEEKNKLLYTFNNTKADYPMGKTIHQLFEEQVDRTPQSVAVSCNGEKISYNELNIRSNQLAYYLKKKSITNTLVGIMTERSIEMVVGIFGVLKSGNAYLPLDIHQPLERNIRILEDSQAEIILTNKDGISLEKIEVVNLKDESVYAEQGVLDSNTGGNSRLSYVIYTSGSTGLPKGVMVTHENLVNFIAGMKHVISPKDPLGSILSLTTISFDIFGLELYYPLLNGGTMFLVGEESIHDIDKINAIVQTEEVKVLQLTPSRLRLMLLVEASQKVFEHMRLILVGGEEFPLATLSILRSVYRGSVFNMYGPTETTVWSTCKDVSAEGAMDIGQPIANTEVYILGKSNRIQPLGVLGELCISGKGVAQGYLNNPELTGEKFIPHPFREDDLVYRTGDLARWLPDGNIEFLGRVDNQVKIRGFRIELGEIESVLLGHEIVRECVVIVREENGDRYLCAYVVCDRGEVDKDELRSYLLGKLPDYMIPTYFVQLERLPLTSNGKTDRKSLPSPEIKAGDDYVGPTNDVERKILKIWSKILNIEQDEISINSNFFSIGGHSLKAAMLASMLGEEFNVKYSLSEVFKADTVQKMAKTIAVKNLIDQDISEIEINKEVQQIVI